MATLTAGYSFGSTETVTNTKLGLLVTGASVTGIVNSDVDASAAISDTKLDLATIAQAMQFNGEVTCASTFTMSSNIFKLAKGADVASVAGAITLGDDGNFFDITGTAAITSITAKTAGTVVTLQFDSTASLVDGSNLKLAGNMNGAAESTITLVSDGTNWFEVCRQPSSFTPTASNALSGSIIQVVNTDYSTITSNAATIPDDDTTPQNTEGTEAFTVSITPNNSSNSLWIRARVHCSNSTATNRMIIALFQDSTAGALSTAQQYCSSSGAVVPLYIDYFMSAGTTSSTTFKIRYGSGAGTTYINRSGDSQRFNGTLISGITVMEIKA